MGIRVLKGLSSMKALTVHASSKQTLQSSHSSHLTLGCYIIHLRERVSLFLFRVRDPLHVFYAVEIVLTEELMVYLADVAFHTA